MTRWLIKSRLYIDALVGRGILCRSLALLLLTGSLLGVFSEVAGFMYVTEHYHIVLKDSIFYCNWGSTPFDREYDADHALKRAEPYVADLWAADERMGFRLKSVPFNPWRSRFRAPWFESLQGTGSFCLPLVWFYLGFVALVGIATWRRSKIDNSFPKCNMCGYNLIGNISGRCPECGTPIDFATLKSEIESGAT